MLLGNKSILIDIPIHNLLLQKLYTDRYLNVPKENLSTRIIRSVEVS